MYHEDMPRYEGLYVELEIWKDKWARCKEDVPSTLIQSLVNCDKDTFPNLNRLFSIGCIIPVTSCEAERSFSAFRRLKSFLRSSMGEGRLSSLAMMNIHYNCIVNAHEVVEIFIQKRPRRLFASLYDKNT